MRLLMAPSIASRLSIVFLNRISILSHMLQLHAEKRDITGKKLAGLRASGKLPVVIYGPKEKSAPFAVDAKEFRAIWKQAGESSIISFMVGSEEKDVLIHDVALDPLTDLPIHADLYAIEKGKPIQVSIPLEFSGVAPAVKSLGGVLVKVLHEVEIEALPRSLPHSLIVDISSLLTFDDRIAVKDIVLPEGVSILSPDGDETVALVSEPKEEKEEESAPVDLSKIEVEKKGKKPEEAGEEASA